MATPSYLAPPLVPGLPLGLPYAPYPLPVLPSFSASSAPLLPPIASLSLLPPRYAPPFDSNLSDVLEALHGLSRPAPRQSSPSFPSASLSSSTSSSPASSTSLPSLSLLPLPDASLHTIHFPVTPATYNASLSPARPAPDVEPRFACRIPGCFRHYRYKSDLKEHTRKKHGEHIALAISPARSTKDGKPYPCPTLECPCGFRRLKDLKRHIRLKHLGHPGTSEEEDDDREELNEEDEERRQSTSTSQ